jgi:hypothetical protein
MGRGASAKLNHANIRQSVLDVLSKRNAIKYDDFKEQVAKQYDVLTGQQIVNRNDWRAAWRRCSRSALLVLTKETDWVKIKHRVLTDVVCDGKQIYAEEYELIRRFLIPSRNISAKQKRKLSR